MKKLNKEILEQVKNRHFEYCKTKRPQNNKKIDDKLCWKLCCENPFDFNNTNPLNPKCKFLHKDYWDFVDGDIDYRSQYREFRSPREEDLKDKNKWNGIRLLELLEIDVCPYCGLNYITSVEKEYGKIVTTATFDHYFPKGKTDKNGDDIKEKPEYAFLALNLYNLIPVCKNCNSSFKKNLNETIMYPYDEALEDFITFKIKEEKLIEQFIKQKNNNNMEIIIGYDKKNVRLKDHIKHLAIKERYNNFQNLAKSLILKKQIYNETYNKDLNKLNEKLGIQKNAFVFLDIFSDRDEVFSKFKKDIWKQLKKY